MKLFLQKYDIYVVAFVAAILLLANLGNQYLWQDEAQTTLISKTILITGECGFVSSNLAIKPELCNRKSIPNQNNCKSVASLTYLL